MKSLIKLLSTQVVVYYFSIYQVIYFAEWIYGAFIFDRHATDEAYISNLCAVKYLNENSGASFIISALHALLSSNPKF